MEIKQDEYIISNWDKLCRICLTHPLSLPVYKLNVIDDQNKVTFCDMLNTCTNLQVSPDDSFPQLICSLCVTQMHQALEFKIKCQSSNNILTQLFHKKNDLNNIIKCEIIEIKEADTDYHDVDEFETENIVDNVFITDIDEKESIKDKLNLVLPNKNMKLNNVKSAKMYNCAICHVSSTYKELVVHKRTHPNTCWKCNINFKSTEEYNEHLKEHEENVCSECGKVFKNKGLCSAHKVTHAKSELQSVSLQKKNDHCCPICHKPCKSKELPTHKKTHPNTCWKCIIVFKSTEEYDEHLKEHKKKECSECGKVFKNAKLCYAHQKIHSKDKWLCTICGKKLNTRNALSVHYRQHTGEKIYECNYCTKKFLHWNVRKFHIRNHHTFEKPFACDVCSSRFSTKGHLSSHMKSHTNERRFACSFCDLMFRRNTDLKKHNYKHSGEKRVFCTVCNKGFVTNHNLKVHMVTHTGEKNHVCSVCHKGFSQAHVLRTHMKTHNMDSTSNTEQHDETI